MSAPNERVYMKTHDAYNSNRFDSAAVSQHCTAAAVLLALTVHYCTHTTRVYPQHLESNKDFPS